jgi:hypothetical protein
MIEGLAADFLVLVHLSFMVFVLLGGFLVLRWKQAAWFHIPCAVWGAAVELGGWGCPLTSLELHFLQLAGEAGYGGGFIDHYVTPLVYPVGLSRGLQVFLGGLVLAVNFGVYGRVLVNHAHGRNGRKAK